MNKKLLFILFLSLTATVTLALPAFAAGIVPECANTICTICDMWSLANNIMNFLLIDLAIPVLIIMLIWGGVLWVTAGASPKNIEQGKTIITSALIGVLIAFAGWLAVDTIIKSLASGGSVIGAWQNFPTCELATPEDITVSGNGGGGAVVNNSYWTIQVCPVASCTTEDAWNAASDQGSYATQADCTQQANSVGGARCVERTSGGGGGSCVVGTGLYNTPDFLAGTCMDGNSENASKISQAESGGNIAIASGVHMCQAGQPSSVGQIQTHLNANGKKVDASCDPAQIFQINGGGTQGACLERTGSGVCKKYDCTVTNQPLFDSCMTKLQDPATNVRVACQLSGNPPGSRWSAWGANSICQL